MVPPQLHVEGDRGENDKNHQRDDLLDHLELHQVKRSSVSDKSHPVGGHLKTVLKESDAPRKQDHEDQRGRIGDESRLLQFEMTVPRQRHEDVGGQ